MRIEAQRRVALFQEPRPCEFTVSVLQPLFAPMLGDDDRTSGERAR
jgi:hypothetical protein